MFKCVIVGGWRAQSGRSGNNLSKQVHHTPPEARAAPWPIKNMSVRVVSDFFLHWISVQEKNSGSAYKVGIPPSPPESAEP